MCECVRNGMEKSLCEAQVKGQWRHFGTVRSFEIESVYVGLTRASRRDDKGTSRTW